MYQQGYSPSNRAASSQGDAWYAPGPQTPAKKGGGAGKGKKAAPSDGGRKKPSLGRQLIKALLVLLVLAAAGAGGYILKVQGDVRPYRSVFLPNVSVDGIDLGGMTWAEGSQAVWNQVNAKQNDWYVRLKNSAGEYKDITAAMLGISFDPTMALEQAWAVGHDTDANNRKDIFQLQREIQVSQSVSNTFSSAQQSADTSPIDNILETLQTVAYKRAQDAALIGFNPDDTANPFVFQQEVYGQILDTTAVKAQILEMVDTLQSGDVMLETTSVPPSVTVAQLQKQVELRFRAVTPIASASTEERTENIRTCFSRINGLVLESGKKFSFNNIVGKRTIANGFQPAIEYAYGLEVPGIGGGTCQASTTVYLAAIQSGLKINHREQHSNPVSYTELGMDATVSDTRGREIDFSFTNNTDGPIYLTAHVIQSGTNKRNLLCEVRIYGLSLGNVSYTLQSQTVETLLKPEEPVLTNDETGEHVTYQDETKLYSKGRDGYVVETYLVTVQDGQQVDRKLVAKDTYNARADRYWVGVTPRLAY